MINMKLVESKAAPLSNNLNGMFESLIVIGSMWANVRQYVVKADYFTPYSNIYAERQAMRTLLDVDTYTVCLVVLFNESNGGRPNTIRQLSKALEHSDEARQKAMARKIKRILEVANHYGLLESCADVHEVTKQPCTRVLPLQPLREFFKEEISPMYDSITNQHQRSI